MGIYSPNPYRLKCPLQGTHQSQLMLLFPIGQIEQFETTAQNYIYISFDYSGHALNVYMYIFTLWIYEGMHWQDCKGDNLMFAHKLK